MLEKLIVFGQVLDSLRKRSIAASSTHGIAALMSRCEAVPCASVLSTLVLGAGGDVPEYSPQACAYMCLCLCPSNRCWAPPAAARREFAMQLAAQCVLPPQACAALSFPVAVFVRLTSPCWLCVCCVCVCVCVCVHR